MDMVEDKVINTDTNELSKATSSSPTATAAKTTDAVESTIKVGTDDNGANDGDSQEQTAESTSNPKPDSNTDMNETKESSNYNDDDEDDDDGDDHEMKDNEVKDDEKDEEAVMNDNTRDLEDDENIAAATVDKDINDYDEIDLSKPLKKPPTAYFIFLKEKRPQVQKELSTPTEQSNDTKTEKTMKKASVTDVAKKLGKLWSNLSIDEKEVYHAKARKGKELYEKHRLALLKAGKLIDANTKSGEKKDAKYDPLSTILPVSKIRKICRLDPDVKGMAKESTLLITKAAELFIEKIANDTVSIAKLHQKQTIYAKDVADVCSLKEVFFFLKDDMRDLIQEQTTEKKRKRELKTGASSNSNADGTDSQKKKIAKSPVMVGVKPLTSYFLAAQPANK